ncbi:MAG: hydrogenase iron-sulfur subunit [Candidatus Zixiibacteriota bacterium]
MRNPEPEIMVFACSWHPYTAADNAGAEKVQYQSNVKIIKVNCTGNLTTGHILRAFAGGADGVLVAGCGIGECHYIRGNESCREVIEEAKEILQVSGIDKERLSLELFSDVDGSKFASLMDSFVDRVKSLRKVEAGIR